MQRHQIVDGEPVASPREEPFDIVDPSRPRDVGFAPIGDIVRPMVRRLAQHLADNGVIEPSKVSEGDASCEVREARHG